MFGANEDKPIPTVTRFWTVVTQKFHDLVGGDARLLLGVKVVWRQYHEAQCAVIRDIRVRREDVTPFEERPSGHELSQYVGQLVTHVVLVVKPAFATFRFNGINDFR